MTITARGNSWLVSVGSGKDRKRITVKTKTEAEALERNLMQAQLEAQYRAFQAAQRGAPSKTLQDAYDITYRDVWKGSKGEKSACRNALDVLSIFSPDTPVTEIDTEAMDEAIDTWEDRGNTGATINRKLSALSMLLKTAEDRGWLKVIPKVRRRKESQGRIFWFTEEEERGLLKGCQALGLFTLADAISFGIATGLRRSELLGLKVADTDHQDLRLHHGETKNSDARVVPLNATALPIVQKARDEGHARVFEALTDAELRRQWNLLREHLGKDGDPKYVFHVLRHTTATRLAFGGANAFQIMTFMGHKSIQTSMRYVHLAGGNLADLGRILERR